MNIALFTDSYLPNTDGVVSSILAYKSGLEAQSHRLSIFAPDADMAKKEPGVYRFAALKFPPYPEYRAAIFPFVSGDVAKKNSLQLVHCKAMMNMALSAISFASRTKLPAMASLETMIPDSAHYIIPHKAAEKIGRRVGWAYLRWLYSHFRIVTAPSRHTQRLMAENRIESEVLPSPVDTERFKPGKGGALVRKTLGLSKKKVIASIGRVVREKNYSFLLRVAKEIKDDDTVFLIVGRGPYLDELRQEAWKAGVSGKFAFVGYVPEELLVDYYNAADAFVFPSLFETQGLALMEALACGKPGCVIRQTPMEEMINEGKNGYVFSEDEKECAEKLSACLAKGSGLSENARKTALHYSIPNCTKKLVGVYERLLE